MDAKGTTNEWSAVPNPGGKGLALAPKAYQNGRYLSTLLVRMSVLDSNAHRSVGGHHGGKECFHETDCADEADQEGRDPVPGRLLHVIR